APTTVSAQGLANTGTINLTGSGTKQATLDIAAPAPATWTGVANLSGDAVLEFASSSITNVAAGGRLIVGGASFVADAADITHNSALTSLTSVAGDFEVQFGDAVALAGSLAVTGTVNIDTQPFNSVGSSLDIGGDLDNSGTITIGLNNFGDGGSTVG